MKLNKLVTTLVLLTALNPYGNVCHADLYGELARVDGKWRFSNIGTERQRVNVNSKEPIGYNTSSYGCSTQLWGNYTQCNESELYFRNSSTHYISSLFMNIFGVAFLFVGPIKYGISVNKTSYFDNKAFEDAVGEAYNNDVSKYASEYNTFAEFANAKESEQIAVVKGKIALIYEKYSNLENEFTKSIEISYSFNDFTGMWPKDQLPEDKLAFNPARLKMLVPEPKIDLAITNDSPEVFYAKLINLKKEFDSKLVSQEKSLISAVEKYEIDLSNSIKKINLPPDKEINKDNFNIKCNYTYDNSHGQHPKVIVSYTIISKNLSEVYPKYSNTDENLDFHFDGTNFNFINKTNKFLQVKSISVYYNNEVFNVEKENYFELPPETHKSYRPIELLSATNIIKEAKYPNMNKQNARGTNFSFGFAIKYKCVDQNIDKTLYKANKYVNRRAIMTHLRP
jgi:hypothetical protein